MTYLDGIVPGDLSGSLRRIKVQRFGMVLTTWDIVHDRREDTAPPRDRSRRRGTTAPIREIIENVSGVIECAVWELTGSVLIRFDPDLTTASRLLRILDLRTTDTGIIGRRTPRPETRWIRAGSRVARHWRSPAR